MNNKYITSFILILVVFSSFLYISNTSSDSESAVTTSTTLLEETSTTSPSTTKVEETSTTTSLVPISKIAVSEDSESVQIISNEDDEVVIYEGPFTSFAGFEGTNQLTLDSLVDDLPATLKAIIEEEVLVINGCHQYALSLVGRCPYGVWDSSGTDPEGEKGADWALSIWISDRAFAAGQVKDVLIHEASHALAYLIQKAPKMPKNNFDVVLVES